MSKMDLLTLPQIARMHGASERQAEYAVRINGIEPSARVGIVRLFDAESVSRVVSAMVRTGAIRRGEDVKTA